MYLVRNGVLENLVYSRFWAKQKGKEPTPGPVNSIMESSQRPASLEEMIKATERGILLGRFWYIRGVDPRTALQTGLTRDGIWYIENGRDAISGEELSLQSEPDAVTGARECRDDWRAGAGRQRRRTRGKLGVVAGAEGEGVSFHVAVGSGVVRNEVRTLGRECGTGKLTLTKVSSTQRRKGGDAEEVHARRKGAKTRKVVDGRVRHVNPFPVFFASACAETTSVRDDLRVFTRTQPRFDTGFIPFFRDLDGVGEGEGFAGAATASGWIVSW